MKDYSHHRIIY